MLLKKCQHFQKGDSLVTGSSHFGGTNVFYFSVFPLFLCCCFFANDDRNVVRLLLWDVSDFSFEWMLFIHRELVSVRGGIHTTHSFIYLNMFIHPFIKSSIFPSSLVWVCANIWNYDFIFKFKFRFQIPSQYKKYFIKYILFEKNINLKLKLFPF